MFSSFGRVGFGRNDTCSRLNSARMMNEESYTRRCIYVHIMKHVDSSNAQWKRINLWNSNRTKKHISCFQAPMDQRIQCEFKDEKKTTTQPKNHCIYSE